jgi:hypothetical protein
MAVRRIMTVCGSALALVVAVALGPLGSAGEAPYVYGCTPVLFFNDSGSLRAWRVSLSIYNGSAATANITTKVLAGDGTIMNGSLLGSASYIPPVTSSIPATRTAVFSFALYDGIPGMSDSTVPASVRIVSNVPVSATLSHEITAADWRPNVCTDQVP